MTKNKGGRPTKMTPETVQKLEDAFIKGCTDTEACCYAEVSIRTLYDYCEKYPEFSHRKELLKDDPTMKAKFIIYDELVSKNVNQANRVIDRKEGTKIKNEITGKDGNPIETTSTFNFVPVGKK